jgi:RYK receptor-like tyrosine kinase
VKVADNALSRDLFPGDYECIGDGENRPLRWMAPEAIVDKDFSQASDVVSYTFSDFHWKPHA